MAPTVDLSLPPLPQQAQQAELALQGDHSPDLHLCHLVLKQHNKITNNIVQADGMGCSKSLLTQRVRPSTITHEAKNILDALS